MRIVFSFVTLAAMIWAGSCGFAQESSRPKNLLENGSFETRRGDELTGWVQRTWSGNPVFEIVDEDGRGDGRCVRISSRSGADASWSQRVKVKPNSDYRVSVWIKTKDVAAGGFGAQINFHELQMEGKTEAVRGNNDWTLLSSEFNSGSRNELLLNLLFGGWGRATGTAWFDDVELVELKKEISIPVMTESEAGDFFEKKVLPIFQKNCFECHGSGDKIRGDFVMTNRDDLVAGGESGEAIDLENPLDSLLLSAINYDSYEMPPTGKLPQAEIDAITTWVQLGSPWKGEALERTEREAHVVPQVNAETKQWWSYQKPVRPAVPETSNDWVMNEVDSFILAKLGSKSIKPNPMASRQTLIRRVYYDLIGLPPTVEEVDAFVNDPDPAAYTKLVDHLLASPHYGEKWARHWLDLVRYAESNSYERDGTKPFVWRYRDYVIEALNKNKPYDEFVIEQLAGDELPDHNPEQLIATGYYRLGKWDDEPVDHKQAWFDDMDDVLATTSQAFLGMTINCARCHDHKIDPVPQADYYRMLAFFRNVQRYGVRGHDTVLRQSTRPIVPQADQERHSAEVESYNVAVRKNREALDKIEQLVKQDFIPVEHEEFKHEMNRVPLVRKRTGKKIGDVLFEAAEADRYEQLFDEMKRLRSEPPKQLEAALCVTENGPAAPPTHVLVRGNAGVEADEVAPGFPSILSPPEPEIEVPADRKSTGRRLALARWIASKENPMTARVMVNRIWQHHFGRGIVRSSNDFGFQGRAPTHPELLDWLATEFMESGWNIKHMHRVMMNSATYQMSSKARPELAEIDPLNDLFWRFDMRRLTAEEVRDSILAINGSLNQSKMFGPSIYPTIPDEVLQGQSIPGQNWYTSSPAEQARRSIYIHLKRSLPVPIMASFDVADTDSSCAVRFNTVQPTQALGMLNSKFINDEAVKLADFVSAGKEPVLDDQLREILERVLQRRPEPEEIQLGKKFVQDRVDGGLTQRKALELFCVVAFNLNEFMYLD